MSRDRWHVTQRFYDVMPDDLRNGVDLVVCEFRPET